MEIKKNGRAHQHGEIFYPDMGDNLDLPVSQRAGIRFTRMTGRELEGKNRQLLTKIKPGRKALQKTMTLEAEKRKEIVVACAQELVNWTFTDDETGSSTAVTDIEVLISAVKEHWPNAQEAAGFVDQCYDFVTGESVLEEQLLGESSSPPGSS